MTAHPSVLKRLGGGAVTLAVLTLGVAGGLLLGAPASSADPGDIQVKMAGDSDFSTTAASPLLNVTDLAPGGSVTGTMQIRDASDTDGRHGITDTLSLQMINLTKSDDCDVAASCTGSGEALAHALSFTVDVSGPPPGHVPDHPAETVNSLIDGVPLAVKLRKGDTISLTLTASLPEATGNAVAYGKLKFDLALALTPVQPGNSGSNGNGNGAGSGSGGLPGSTPNNNAGAGGNAPVQVEVLGTSRVEAAAPGAAKPGPGSVLVLGQHRGSLSYTGLPLYALLAAGGGILVVGIVLILAGRQQRAAASGTGS